MPSPIQGGRAHNCRREAAKAFLEVAELGQHAGVTAVARQRLLVKPPGFGLDALVAVGLVPLEKLLHRALPSDTAAPACALPHTCGSQEPAGLLHTLVSPLSTEFCWCHGRTARRAMVIHSAGYCQPSPT